MGEYPRLVNISNGQIVGINLDTFSVGRSLKCSYILDSVYISRTHFILEKNNGTWVLRDNSSNGTLLNGQVISFGRTEILKDGDLIKLINAETEFRFELYPSSVTDEQLCEALEAVVCAKNQVNERSVLNDHCYEIQTDVPPIVVNEVIISEHGNEISDPIIPCPLPGTSSVPDVTNQRKRSSSGEPSSTNDADQSPIKKNKPDSPEEVSKHKTEVNALKQTDNLEKGKCKNETEIKFDIVEEEMQCSICSELFIKAVTLNCCHTFCKYCIEQWKKQQCCCPICRKTITSMAPTLVLDNCIDKIVSQMDDETKETRKQMRALRLAAENPPSTSKKPQTRSATSTATSSTTTSSGTTIVTTVTISSGEDDDEDYSDEDDYDEYYDDYDGMPGSYYGGYGRCFNCNRTGHWAPGCPYR